jgi:hypothetical protein
MIAVEREKLAQMTEAEGLMRTAECFTKVTEILRSWWRAAQSDDSILVMRYEDLTQGKTTAAWAKLLAHCDIPVPEGVMEKLVHRYQFKNMSGGRRPGQEDKSEKYRKGVVGDWKNYFDDRLERRFYEVNGDIVGELGYR